MTLVIAIALHFSALWMAAAGGYGAGKDRTLTVVFWCIAWALTGLGIWLAAI